MESSGESRAEVEHDSRTSTITAKRPLDEAGGYSTPSKRLKQTSSKESLESYHQDSSLTNGSGHNGTLSDTSGAGDEEDGTMSISSGREEDDNAAIEMDGQNARVQPEETAFNGLKAESPATNTELENDLDLPLEQILQRLPTKQDFLKAWDKKHGERYFNRHQKTLPLRANTTYVKRLTQAFHKYHEAKNRVLKVQKKGKTKTDLEESAVRDAKIRLAWCIYYPVTQAWVEPPSEGHLSGKKLKMTLTQEATKQGFLARVEACLDEGSLMDLRLGRFGGPDKFEAIEADKPRITEGRQIKTLLASKRAKAKRLRKKSAPEQPQALTDLQRTVKNLRVDQNYNAFFPLHRSYVPISTFKNLGESAGNAVSSEDGTPAQVWNFVQELKLRQLVKFKEGMNFKGSHGIAPSLRNPSDTRIPNSEALDLVREFSPVTENSIEEFAVQPDASSLLDLSSETDAAEDTNEVYIDEETSESGEISTGSDENGITLPNIVQDSAATTVLPVSQIDGVTEVGSVPDQTKSVSDRAQGRKILAELAPEDLNDQLRYFHAHKQVGEVSMDCAVRCFCCGDFGHIAGECEKLVCSKCDAYNMHLTLECDVVQTCLNCRESGHGARSCPYKIKAPSSMDDPCPLCSFPGHVEADCEMLWRTSGVPWEANINPSQLQLFCYECGKQNHLGNDCPTRQPGKPFGTSTWSLKREPPRTRMTRPMQTKFSQGREEGLSIQGHADNRMKLPPKPRSQNLIERRPDQAIPVPPKPTSKGRIQINPGIAQSTTVDSFRPEWTPVSDSSSQSRTSTSDHRPRIASNPMRLPNHNQESHYRPDLREVAPPPRGAPGRQTNEWPRPALSSNPQYPDYEADMRYEYHDHQASPMNHPLSHGQQQPYLGNHPVQPSPYQQPQQRQPRYQPMPSSGKRAWAQFRK